jgi:hypothetical protein
MNRIFLGAAALGALAATSAAAETKSFDLKNFTRVSVSAGTDVEIVVGPEFSVAAEGEQKAVDKLDVKVEGDMLTIGRKPSFSMFGHQGLVKVKVTLPILSALLASSGADASAANVDAAQFKLKATSGASAKASGLCIGLAIEASSGGDADATELVCEDATAEASSGADVDVFASKSVIAEASSGGDITVHGKPAQVDITKSSGGDVSVE